MAIETKGDQTVLTDRLSFGEDGVGMDINDYYELVQEGWMRVGEGVDTPPLDSASRKDKIQKAIQSTTK